MAHNLKTLAVLLDDYYDQHAGTILTMPELDALVEKAHGEDVVVEAAIVRGMRRAGEVSRMHTPPVVARSFMQQQEAHHA